MERAFLAIAVSGHNAIEARKLQRGGRISSKSEGGGLVWRAGFGENRYGYHSCQKCRDRDLPDHDYGHWRWRDEDDDSVVAGAPLTLAIAVLAA